MIMDDANLTLNSPDLYDVIRNKYNKVSMTDADGNDTVDQSEATQFDIGMGSNLVTISLVDPKVLKVFYNKDMLDNGTDDVARWEDLVGDLKKFIIGRDLTLDLHPTDRALTDIDREKLSIKAKEEVTESRFSKWDGSKKTSFQGLEKVKVKVRHRKAVDENIHGARSRNVSKVFIETAEGERFKFPFPLLDGARAMARHIEEGGNWNDRIGQHILDLSEKVMTIKKFARQARKSGVTESALPVVIRLSEKLDEYKKKLHLMQGSRGYHSYKTTMAETYIEPVEHFSGLFAKVDENLMELMPGIERILGERENVSLVTESISQFVKWIDSVTLNEAAPNIPVQYIDPPKDQTQGGRSLNLTPDQIQKIVKANRLTSTPQAIAALRTGKVSTPVVQQSGAGYKVISGGDVLALMATTPNKVKVINMPATKPVSQQTAATNQSGAAAKLAAQDQDQTAVDQAQKKTKLPTGGFMQGFRQGKQAGAGAVNAVTGKIAGVAGAISNLPGSR